MKTVDEAQKCPRHPEQLFGNCEECARIEKLLSQFTFADIRKWIRSASIVEEGERICAGCRKKLQLAIEGYRCLDCPLFFCEPCARYHFDKPETTTSGERAE